ncbi:hypothetical protein GX50_03042 [[Emmonsia] crescens]|uniref:Mso1 N-terminal domain-containing protein n=1 Tax=[Emmonsia] crescens TaxID=73230 RepID=A0A2B7ZLX5_9EURO|nr:hypothetical protein GX50_03042 [Emmonsia crescens]
MTSYFSSLKSSSAISNFSTRFNSLRRAISSGDETDDADSEDCSHISNVLRAYYTEKGRRFPPWLPADPKSPVPPPPTIAVTTQAPFQGYGGGTPPGGPAAGGRSAGGSGLGDLWGDSGPARPAPQQQQTSSLRLGRNASHQPATTSSTHLMPSPANVPTRPATSATGSRTAGSYFERQQSHTTPPPTATAARPLPSQRAGSYQTSQAAAQQQGRLGSGIERSTSGVSAQERLRARLHGGGTNAPPARTPSPGYRNEQSGGGGQPYAGSSRPWEAGDPYGSSTYGVGGNGNGLPGRRVGQPRGPR